MDTVRVNIAYRPLRICWAIKDGDFAAFRKAVRINHSLWGGRFNPIVIIDHKTEATSIVNAFRADIVFPVGSHAELQEFVRGYSHLISPFFHDGIYIGDKDDANSQVLDVQNALFQINNKPDWKYLSERKPKVYKWSAEDPLADILLMQLGSYPDKDEIHIDYESMFKEALNATEFEIDPALPLPADILECLSISYLSRHGLIRHYSIQSHWDYPGFYFGDVTNLHDLVTFWNLRAADTTLLFVDSSHLSRYTSEIPVWKKHVAELLARKRYQEGQSYAIWWLRKNIGAREDHEKLQAPFGNEPATICGVDEFIWNGLNIKPPMMYFNEAASLGVIVEENEKPKVSFGLNDRPYSNDVWFHTQHLVASVSVSGALYARDDFTLCPPYVPELNEFYARAMHFSYDSLRIESERIGLIVEATSTDCFIYALPTTQLFKQIFKLAGFDASLSPGGLITRQLISQVGGLQGARVFKIPGARRLIKTHGPTTSFSKRTAQQLIGCKDPDNPNANFEDHKGLYLEPREPGTNLEPIHVFNYLVKKRLFRVGYDLDCPRCQLGNWFPIDDLRQKVTCQLCGEPFDATHQLIGNEWSYRRSGVLGVERNAQGAIPVALTLQQFDTNLGTSFDPQSYSVSLIVTPLNGQLSKPCEVDFVWLITRRYPDRTTVVIGECKDRGHSPAHSGDGGTINADDVANLRAVADSFPQDKFEVYIAFAKLCAFTPQEIELTRSLNDEHLIRVILLTDRELEPYHLFERTEKQFTIARRGTSPKNLAMATVSIFFDPQPIIDKAGQAPKG